MKIIKITLAVQEEYPDNTFVRKSTMIVTDKEFNSIDAELFAQLLPQFTALVYRVNDALENKEHEWLSSCAN